MDIDLQAIDAFLEGVRTGDWDSMEQYYLEDAVFEGTVPRWHFTVFGNQAVVRQMGEWFPHLAEVHDVHVIRTEDGAVVEFERHWRQGDAGSEEVGVRQAHIFRLDVHGRIREQHGHCAGIWDQATFAEVEQARPAR